MKVTLKSVKCFSFMASSERELFTDYFNRQNGNRPKYFIEKYLRENGATDFSIDLYNNSSLLRKIHGNYRKTALLNCFGQAFLDSIILSEMTADIIEITPQIKSICVYTRYSDVCLLKLKEELLKVPTSFFTGTPIESVINNLEKSIKEFIINQKTTEYILDNWKINPNKIYDIDYKYMRQQVSKNA